MESLHIYLLLGVVILFGVGIKGQTTDLTTDETEWETEDPTDDPTTTSTPDESYNCTENGAFPHPIYCEYYFNCSEGIDTLIKCDVNYLFDLVYSGCNEPELTDCGNRTRPDGYPTNIPPGPTTTPGPGFQCPGQDGFYEDANDCTAYYQCSEGYAYHYQCPYPLRFDPILQVCNHAGFVDCGDRPIPGPSTVAPKKYH